MIKMLSLCACRGTTCGMCEMGVVPGPQEAFCERETLLVHLGRKPLSHGPQEAILGRNIKAGKTANLSPPTFGEADSIKSDTL